ncbi:MAG: hypothetical protein ABI688_12130, partial [Bacteroidota bacterium]
MSKKIQLSIAEPCHENWDGMTTVEKGKFCGSCQKQVVDFSNLSDRQVAEFFKKPSTGSVCGRFMTDQLDRSIEIPKKRIPWVKYFFHIALPAFLVSMKVSGQRTQGKVKMTTVAKDTTKRPDYPVIMGMIARPVNKIPVKVDTIIEPITDPEKTIKGEISIAKDTTVKEPPICTAKMGAVAIITPINKKDIEGIIVDENNRPVPFASVETGKPGEGFMADDNGFFKIRKNWFDKGKSLTFSSTGFEPRKITAGEEVFQAGKLLVQLKSNVVLPEVRITTYGHVMGKISRGYVSVIKKDSANQECTIAQENNIPTHKEINLPVEENSILIYPNPVIAGTALNISFKKLDEGYYTFQLLNQAGQLIQQKDIWIDAEARILNADLPLTTAG